MQQLSFHYGLATGSEYDEDNYLGIQIDHFGEAGSVPAEVVMPFGLLARPLDPEVDGDASPQEGCTTMWNEEGSRTAAMPLSDNRVNRLLPKLRKGGSMLYCGAGNYALFDGKDANDASKRAGSFYVGVKYSGKSHLLGMVVRDDGTEFVTLVHGEGHGLVLTGNGKRSAVLKNARGNAYFEACDDGINIVGDMSLAGSCRIGDTNAAASVALIAPLLATMQAMESKILAGMKEMDLKFSLAAAAAAMTILGIPPIPPTTVPPTINAGLIATIGTKQLKAT